MSGADIQRCLYCNAPHDRFGLLCNEHWKLAVQVWNRNDDDEWLCPQCSFIGEETVLPLDSDVREEHFQTEHGFSKDDTPAMVKQRVRLLHEANREERQAGLEMFA